MCNIDIVLNKLKNTAKSIGLVGRYSIHLRILLIYLCAAIYVGYLLTSLLTYMLHNVMQNENTKYDKT
jgi:hypothetical protein